MVAGEFGDGQQRIVLNVEIVDIAQRDISFLYKLSEEWIAAPASDAKIFNGILNDIKDQLLVVADCSAQLFLGIILRQFQNLRKTFADCSIGICKAIVICIHTICGVNHQFGKIHIHCLFLLTIKHQHQKQAHHRSHYEQPR